MATTMWDLRKANEMAKGRRVSKTTTRSRDMKKIAYFILGAVLGWLASNMWFIFNLNRILMMP